MPASKVQLIGGNFQDSEGNVLSNGYLKMLLSQDGSVAGVGSICSGIEVLIKLNSSGSVDTSTPQYIWGNDNISPVNTFYRVTGYTVAGQPAWGPNNQQVIGGPTFDVGSWIPNQVISWTPSNTPVTLENNGSLNSSQTLLNLKSGTGITITDQGAGAIQIAGASGVQLQTNGTNNGNQSKLNLVAGSGVSVTDDGTGDITIASASINPLSSSQLIVVEDFMANWANTTINCPYPNGLVFRIGGGGGGNYTPPSSVATYGPPHIGIMRFQTSATTGTNCQFALTGETALNGAGVTPSYPILLTSTAAQWKIRFIFNIVGALTLQTLQFGILDTFFGVSIPNNGIDIQYDPSASANWQVKKWVNGTGTVLNTSTTAVTTGWHTIDVVGGTSDAITWTVDGTLLYTSTATSLGLAVNTLAPFFNLQTNENVAKTVDFDFFSFGYPTLSR